MLVLRFRLGRSDHAFFFGRRFFLFQLRVLGIFRVFFAFVFLVQAGLGRFRARVGSSKHALLGITRRVVILSVGDMLRQRRRFFFGQIHMGMFFVVRVFVMGRVVMASFMMIVNFGSIAQFEIRAERFHLIPVARILWRRLFHMRVWGWQ